MFPTTEPEELAAHKYYNQYTGTISDNQLKLQQKKLEKLLFSLKKEYPVPTKTEKANPIMLEELSSR